MRASTAAVRQGPLSYRPRSCAWMVLGGLGLLIGSKAEAQESVSVRRYVDVPLTVSAPVRPSAVQGSDGQYHLSYHLFLTSWSHEDIRVERLIALDEDSPIGVYGPRELEASHRFRPAVPFASAAGATGLDKRTIAAGRTAVAYFWLTFDRSEEVPRVIRHRLELDLGAQVRVAGHGGSAVSLLSGEVRVRSESPTVIGPPLRGGPWVCGNGPTPRADNAHQWMGALRGRASIGQRFAIDFRVLDERGFPLKPGTDLDDIDNDDFYAYGAEVLAVADGTVAEVMDGVSDNKPYRDGRIETESPLSRRTFPGNWLTLAIGPGVYAHYGHLQPGSLRHRPGDRVRRGEVIGLLGNSGNSVGPHLHFGLSDRPGFNEGEEGLPYLFDAFRLQVDGRLVERRNELPVAVDGRPATLFFPDR